MYDGPLRIPTASTAARATSATAAMSCSDGQTCASATPKAGGSAVNRSVTVSGVKRPSSEKALTVTSGPSTSSSTSGTPPLDSAAATASASARSSRRRTSVSPRCPCRSDALTTHGSGSDGSRGSNPRGCGTPAAAKALALPRLGRRDRRSPWVDRVRMPIRSATRAAIPTGQSAPGEMIPSTSRARARRSIPSSSSVERIARSSRERKADGLRIAIYRDHVHVAARPGGLEQAELGGAGA